MKKLTKIATATTLGLGLSVSAMASENIQTTSNLGVQPSADLSYAFDDSQDLQVMAMTNQEMEETEGAFAVPGAVAGAGIGAWGYLGGAAGSGNFSWKGLAATTAGGAAVGAVTGPVGISRYYTAARLSGASGFLSSRIK